MPTDREPFPPDQFLERIAAIPAGHDVVDGCLRLVVALTQASVEGADGVSVSLQRNGHYSPHSTRLATLEAEVLSVLTTLIGLGYVATTGRATRLGEGTTTGYILSRAGVLPARRARPHALFAH